MKVERERLYIQANEELQRMHVQQALRLFERAEGAYYDADCCAAGRWDCHMLLGDFEAAWRESDSIASRGNPDPHRFWDGQPCGGRRVLIRCLHGLGDTIQFIRYAALLRDQARTVTIEAQPSLKSLMEEARIADHVITWGEPEPDWDQQIEILELPRVFRTTLASIPNRVPYLPFRGNGRVLKTKSRPLRIGVVWASSSYNPERSLRLDHLAKLFAIPGASFFSLQAGPQQAELESLSGQVANLYDGSPSVLTIAKTLLTIDLVISVDTMLAHLAGAMGRQVWTLLPYRCDWRWMVKRRDSPWYPTMRLFRQERPGDWRTAIRQLEQELHALVTRSNFQAFPSPHPPTSSPISAPEVQEA